MRGFGIRTWLGVAFLSAQLGWVIVAHMIGPARYFVWAPNDYMVEYRIQVTIHGQALTSEQVGDRYHLDASGLYEYPAQHLVDLVQQYEQTYGRKDAAKVMLTYTVDGGKEVTWRWPKP
ncbi:MAG TPA: hypothetical protein VF510_18555 [Ktedonobacterales bacterium]